MWRHSRAVTFALFSFHTVALIVLFHASLHSYLDKFYWPSLPLRQSWYSFFLLLTHSSIWSNNTVLFRACFGQGRFSFDVKSQSPAKKNFCLLFVASGTRFIAILRLWHIKSRQDLLKGRPVLNFDALLNFPSQIARVFRFCFSVQILVFGSMPIKNSAQSKALLQWPSSALNPTKGSSFYSYLPTSARLMFGPYKIQLSNCVSLQSL